jgi:hypothetical protein
MGTDSANDECRELACKWHDHLLALAKQDTKKTRGFCAVDTMLDED